MDDAFAMLEHCLLAVLGALARSLNIKGGAPIKLAKFLSGCVIAAFTGIIIYFLANAFELDRNLAFAIAGIAGWVGPQILDAIATAVQKAIGLKTEEKIADSEKKDGGADE
jgi:hypothetical protein